MPPFRPGHVAVISLLAPDVLTAVRFYRDVVGPHLLPHHDDRPAFDLGGGAHLVIVQGHPAPSPAQHSGPPFPVLAFAVADLDSAVEHLQAHGVDLPWSVESKGGTRWVKFYDPAGNLIEFAQFGK